MTKKHENYPNKADFKPNVDENLSEEEAADLPLADPAESNETKTFRENESKKEGEEEQSAFGVNKELNN